MRRARRVLGIAVLAAVLTGLLAAPWAGRWLVHDDPLPAAADAIVVLAGSVPDRALEAADLWHAGIAPRVVITRERARRGASALRRRGVVLPEDDDLMRLALGGLGLPADAVTRLRRRTYSTTSEAATIARWACRAGLRRVVVVTSASHTRRAGLILRRAFGPGIAVSMRASRYDPFPAGAWWRVRHAAKLVLSEYQKLANYWLRERWHMRPCGGLARRQP